MAGHVAEAKRPRGRPPRTEAQRRAHRTRLVEAAIDAIRRLGPDLSIDDIAAAAGVSKPVIYDEFAGKLGVADAVAVVITDRLEHQVIDQLAAGPSFDIEVVVRAFIEALVNLIDDEPSLYVFLVRSLHSPERGFLDNALLAGIHERAAILVGFIAPGVPEAHLRLLTDGLFGFVLASIESWQVHQLPRKPELIDSLTHVIRVGFNGVADHLTS